MIKRQGQGRAQRGFSLIEAVIVMGVVVALLAVGATWLQSQARNTTRENFAAVQAKEMAMIAIAANKYVNSTAVDGLADSSNMATPPTIQNLIALNYLPANFGYRLRRASGNGLASPLARTETSRTLAA